MNESASDNVLLQQYDVLELFSKDNFIEIEYINTNGLYDKEKIIDYIRNEYFKS